MDDEALEEGFCMSCGHELTEEDRAAAEGNGAPDPFAHYVVGRVESVEGIKGKKLKAVAVVVAAVAEDGAEDSKGGAEDAEAATVSVVTNAKYIDEGWLVVVALPGAVVPAGADPEEDSGAVTVAKASVGGRASHGMLCDSPMLGWAGGAAGKLVVLPEGGDFVVGGKPPAERPAGEGARKA
jgi:tRNA-binding EMAP/Myf-like protein